MDRKHFIGNLAWLTGGLLTLRALPAAAFSLAETTCKGVVKSRGKGLKGVVVSDGYSVVATDKNGQFSFPWNPAAVAVFISTPAGYRFPATDQITRQYQLVQEVKDKDVVFELEPLAQKDLEHEFIIWADPQVKNMKDVNLMLTQSVPDVQKWVASRKNKALIHGICVGDIVWDNHALFPEYEKAVAQMDIPFFQCLGNHDMDYNKGGDETSDDTFQQRYGPCDYSFNRGKVHYIVMDNVRYMGKDREYDGYFATHQLEWLAKDLSFVPKDHLIVFCVHIPVHSGVKNKEDLYAVLGDRTVHIMSGHTHYHVNKITGNIYEHNHGTVCGAWWTGNICVDGTPNGYGVYQVKGNELSWYYKSVGQADDYQMSLHIVKAEDGSQELVANIWNYDKAWSNEYFVNGVKSGSLQSFAGFDPVAYSNMLGPDLPKGRGFAEPRKTDHLYKAKLPADAREVQVTVKDRFGKVFTATKQVGA